MVTLNTLNCDALTFVMVWEIATEIFATPFFLKWDFLYVTWALSFLAMTWFVVDVKFDFRSVGCWLDEYVWQMTTAISIEDVRREVKILKALSGHQNLVKFYDAFEDANNVYIVMEYVTMCSLRSNFILLPIF